MENTKNASLSKLVPVMLCFFAMGFVDLVGIASNYVKADLGLTDSQANIFPSLVFFWFLIFSVPTGMLMSRIGQKKTVLLSLIVTFASLLLPVFGDSYALMLISFSLLGIGNALMQTSLNPLLSNIVRGDRLASSLTFGQFVKAIASFLAPYIAMWGATQAIPSFDLGWRVLFPIYMVIAILAILLLNATQIEEEKEEGKPSTFGQCLALLGKPFILLCFIGIMCHVGIDVGTNTTAPKILMERIGMNATMNSGAIKWNDKYILMVRVEGSDRKSFFAVAESPNGVDNFRFWDYPVTMPDDLVPATNIYDMRLTAHEDGWVYGIFCAERHDPNAAPGDLSSATATAAIARTKDLKNWERLPDLKTKSQQRNVVLHPEFVNGKYALYTRPQDGFIDAGSGGGIGWALIDDITHAEVKEETIIDQRYYHTIKEVKNGEGPHPIKTPRGWLHLAHGVRGCAAGLRYVLYMYMTALEDPTRPIATPAGYFMAPENEERIGDVSNVLFSNGWIADEDGTVYIYYASSDTRMHVAVSTIDKLVDYCMNTPADGLTTTASVETLKKLIDRNLPLLK